MTEPKVSICCVTYNHEKFIRQTLESFLMQKTNFSFEIIIHDDASTDNTAEIIKEYEKKYPDIVKPIYQIENQFSKGKSISKTYNFPRIKGEYVALCEGDDYWTDPLKLQKQVDFLDANPDFSVCFHSVRVFFEDGSIPDKIFPAKELIFNKDILNIEDLLRHNFIQTNSVVYRWRFNDKESIFDLFPENIMPGDYFLHLLHAQKGKIKFIDEVMADYRRHRDGIWWESSNNTEVLHLKYGVKELNFNIELKRICPEYKEIKGHNHIPKLALGFFKLYLKHQKFKEMKEIMDLCPEVFQSKVGQTKS